MRATRLGVATAALHACWSSRGFPGVLASGSDMQSNEQRRVVTTADAAGYCGASTSTFEKLRVFGGGPTYMKLGRRVVYDLRDLDEWLTTKRRQSTSDSRAECLGR